MNNFQTMESNKKAEEINTEIATPEVSSPYNRNRKNSSYLNEWADKIINEEK